VPPGLDPAGALNGSWPGYWNLGTLLVLGCSGVANGVWCPSCCRDANGFEPVFGADDEGNGLEVNGVFPALGLWCLGVPNGDETGDCMWRANAMSWRSFFLISRDAFLAA
jgi:hypothetical protein